MKKIVCLLVSYVILGLGVAFAQEITSLQYFKVKKEISGRMRLIVPDSPELVGPCGACVEKVDYRTIREKVRSVCGLLPCHHECQRLCGACRQVSQREPYGP